jgi:hypothetical protein
VLQAREAEYLALKLMPLAGACSENAVVKRLARLNKLREDLLRASAQKPRRPASPSPRNGQIPKAVVQVLESAPGSMHVSEIHRAVEAALGHAVNHRSIRRCLSEGAKLRKPRFQRTGYGRYRIASGG